MFGKRTIGPDGRFMYKDHGTWGTYYDGTVDLNGKRIGKGKITYAEGGVYVGYFVDDVFHDNVGSYVWSDGDAYLGNGAWGNDTG